MNKATILKLFIILITCTLFSCVESSDYGRYPDSRDRYDDPYYRGSGYDDYENRREWERNRRERDRIEREKDNLNYERERLREEQRRREEESRRAPVMAPPMRREERCPSGFSPSEQKCSVEERRRGCKDMRLPGGLGCVNR